MALTVVLVTSAFLGGSAGNILNRNQAHPNDWTFRHRSANIGIETEENNSPRRQIPNVGWTTASRTGSHNPPRNTYNHHQMKAHVKNTKSPNDMVESVPFTSQNKQAVLTMDNYDGQERLVYKLAPGPGAIIAGRRRDHQFENYNSIPGSNYHKQVNYIKSHQKHKIRGPLFYNRDNTFKNKPINNKIYPLKLSSILATKVWPIAKVFNIGRLKARGAFLSVVLMNYLGLVTIPGFPQHMDPSDVMTTFMNMLTGANKFRF
ncbi:unnamed protein product [Meganyctiphanes norvegica]|uniref:Uncharacterized protein n=1 Tax=Meganyctiphanes norvegica TaxID=48144 RepID=A0AAV2RPR0_MEGNR